MSTPQPAKKKLSERDQAILRSIEKHPGKKDHEIANILRRRWKVKAPEIRALRENGKPSKGQSKGLSRTQFAAQCDPNVRGLAAIRKAISELGPEELVPDTQFRVERCGAVSTITWRTLADDPEFRKYQCVSVGNKRWWARPETVKWAIENVQNTKALP